MSLEKTEWRYLGVVPCSAANVNTILDGIYNLGLQTTYPDGSIRTIGAGSAGTYNLVTSNTSKVLHIDPAMSTLSNKIILASDTSTVQSLPAGFSRFPTMAQGSFKFRQNKSGTWWHFSTTVYAGELLGGFTIFATVIKNPGVYSHWSAVNPFTSGSFFGYYDSFSTTSSGFTGNVYVYESKDCIAVAFIGSQNYFLFAGAILDPESPDITLDAESDGKLYGIITSSFGSNWMDNSVVRPSSNSSVHGSINNNYAGLRSGLNTGSALNQSTYYVKSSIFSPNSSSILQVVPAIWSSPISDCFNVNATLPHSASMFTRSGRLVKIPIVYRSFTTSQTIGRLRDIYFFGNSRIPRRLMNGSVPLGYAFGPSDSSDINCIFLEH